MVITGIPTLFVRMANDVIKAVTGINLIATGKEWIKGFIDGILAQLKNAGGLVKDAVSGLIPKVGNLFGKSKEANQSFANSMPKFSNGGIATSPSLAAEDFKPELIIPLTKPQRAAELLKYVAPILPQKQEHPGSSAFDSLRQAMSVSNGNSKNVGGSTFSFSPTINITGAGDTEHVKVAVEDALANAKGMFERWINDRDYNRARVAMA